MPSRLLVLIVIPATIALAAPAPVQAFDQRMQKRSLPQYRKAWAVIVGINYDHLANSESAEIDSLDTAENDAKAVFDRLTNNYGFEPDNVRLILGKDASRERIRGCFGEAFLGDRESVNSDDCVLFFFAGHGNRRETVVGRENYVGLLYPSDIRVLPGKGIDTTSCLPIDDLLRLLQNLCPARHKLVVLDSCHSGEVFNFRKTRNSGVNRGFRWSLFRQPALQAIAAARASQVASDQSADSEHSPFTQAFLAILDHGPSFSGRPFFTASEMFGDVRIRMSKMAGVNQDPQGNWIDGEGDFYFFPKGLTADDFGASLVSIPAEEPSSKKDPAENASEEDQPRVSTTMIVSTTSVIGFCAIGFVVLWIRRTNRTKTSALAGSEALSGIRNADSPDARPPATLATISEGSGRRLQLALDEIGVKVICVFAGQTDLGRSRESGFCFPFAPRQISSAHSRIRYVFQQQKFLMEDLGSRNGTYVNGEKVSGSVELSMGDVIELGQSIRLECRLDGTGRISACELILREHTDDADDDDAGKESARFMLIPQNTIRFSDLFHGLSGTTSLPPDDASDREIFLDDDGFRISDATVGEGHQGTQKLHNGMQLQIGQTRVDVELS